MLKYYEKHPSDFHGEGLFQIGRFYLGAHEYTKGRDVLIKVTLTDPEITNAWRDLGTSYMMLGNYDEAIKNYEHANQMGDLESIRYIGACYAQERDYAALRQLSPRLIEYATITGLPSEEKYQSLALVIIAAKNSEPPDKKLWHTVMPLLPKADSSETLPDGFETLVEEAKVKLGEP